MNSFENWLVKYWNNGAIVDMEKEKEYSRAIIYYISGMTDNFAIDTYNEIIRF